MVVTIITFQISTRKIFIIIHLVKWRYYINKAYY